MPAAPTKTKPATIDDYIASFPAEVQTALETIRATIRRAAPDAVETIRYGMPTFTLKRDLVHFGAFKSHIGLYPPVRDPDLRNRTQPYRGDRGNLRFPLDQPIPHALIGEIVAARVKEMGQDAAAKRKGRRDAAASP